MQRQYSLEQILDLALSTLRNSIYLRIPGTIVSYDPTTMTATVQPTLSDPRVNVDTGAIVFEPWPPIEGVRVAWPRFGNGAGFIAGPLAANDPVVLEAWDLDPTPALAQGRSTNVANPTDPRRLSGAYWLASPTDMTGPIASAVAAGSAFCIGVDGDPAQIRFTAGNVVVGQAGATVSLSGTGGPKVGRVGDAVSVTIDAATLAQITSSPGTGTPPITLPGTITAGSPNVSSN